VFDSNGSVDADLGASDYIENITVTPKPEIYGYEVRLKCKRHLAYAPIVTGIDVDLFSQPPKRTKLYDWVIVLSPNTTAEGAVFGESSSMNTNTVHRFKLEILH